MGCPSYEVSLYDTNDTVFKRDIPFRDTIFHSKGSESIIFLVVDIFIFETLVEDDPPHDLIFLQLRKILYWSHVEALV